MVTNTISEWTTFERVLIRLFSEKMSAKSLFSVLGVIKKKGLPFRCANFTLRHPIVQELVCDMH